MHAGATLELRFGVELTTLYSFSGYMYNYAPRCRRACSSRRAHR